MAKKEDIELTEEELPNVEHYCFGCGVKLQSDNPKAKGYIPSLINNNHQALLCQRCFRIQHYSEEQGNEEFNEEEFLKILDKAKAENAVVVYVLDLFSFESTFVSKINERLAEMDVIVIANKRDVLPRSVSDEKLTDFVISRCNEIGINVIDIVITSANKNYNIDELISKIMSLRHDGNVYVVGSASAGKSSIINTLLKNYSNETSHFITTSPYPGTTIDVIEVPLDDNSFIYDTPGLTVRNSMIAVVDHKTLNVITPKNEIKPVTYQLDAEQSIIVGGLAYFDFIKGPKTNFTIYKSNLVQVTRSKLKRAPDVFDILVKTKQITPVCANVVKSHKDLIEHKITVGKRGKYDIGIAGYGWVSLEGAGQEVVVHAPKAVAVYVVEAKI